MLLTRLVIVCALAMTLGACGTFPKGSVQGSEGGALKAPDFVVKGKTVHDQRWIDETIEGGVAGLGWKRPEGRPAEWDKPLSRLQTDAPGVQEPAQMPPAAKPKKKRAKWLRFFHRKDKEVEGG